LHHCWDILENDEKWTNRLSIEILNKRKTPTSSIGDGLMVLTDKGSSIPTPFLLSLQIGMMGEKNSRYESEGR
jgi:hypothetical protein